MTHAVADDDGLICGFELGPVAPCGPEILREDDRGRALWLHLNLSNARARKWLQDRAPVPPAARAALLHADARLRVELFPEGVFAVLTDLDHDFRGEPESFGTMRIYVDGERMISARRKPLRSVDRLRRELQRGGVEIDSPMRLFEHFVDCLAETLGAVVAKLGDEVDDLEDRILNGHFATEGKALGRMRRFLAQLRRRMSADRTVLGPLPVSLPGSFSEEQRQGLREAIAHLDGVGQDLDLVQERARLLQEEIAGRLGEATNRNLFVLSVVTTTLLPITLITGIFGMNVGGLPWLESKAGFYWVMFIIICAVVTTLLVLRSRRVL